MSHSKAFGMTNLGYKIRIPQKIYNRATITEKVYYENYWNRLYLPGTGLHLDHPSPKHTYFQLLTVFHEKGKCRHATSQIISPRCVDSKRPKAFLNLMPAVCRKWSEKFDEGFFVGVSFETLKLSTGTKFQITS